MSVGNNWPAELNRKSYVVKYETEEERACLIESLAERISVLLSECLIQKWHEARASRAHLGHKFYQYPKGFLSEENIQLFKEDLKRTVINDLNGSEKYFHVKFDTEGGNEERLYDIFDRNRVQQHTSTCLSEFYPIKLSVLLKSEKPLKEVSAHICYRIR